MNISKYEAAALYDFTTQNIEKDDKYLVMDLDDCSFGICNCFANGKTQLIESYNIDSINIWNKMIELLYAKSNIENKIDFDKLVDTEIIEANKTLDDYISSYKHLDRKIFSKLGCEMLCSEFEAQILDLKNLLIKLIDNFKGKLSNEELENINIILLGKAQEFDIFTYYIKEKLSYTPFLPDERFINYRFKDSYNEIVKLGYGVYEQGNTFKHSYSIVCYSGYTNKEEIVYSVRQGDKSSDKINKNYSSPILVMNGDKLSLKIDDVAINVNVPYSISNSNGDVIEVSFEIKNQEDILHIHRLKFPTEEYDVKLSEIL